MKIIGNKDLIGCNCYIANEETPKKPLLLRRAKSSGGVGCLHNKVPPQGTYIFRVRQAGFFPFEVRIGNPSRGLVVKVHPLKDWVYRRLEPPPQYLFKPFRILNIFKPLAAMFGKGDCMEREVNPAFTRWMEGHPSKYEEGRDYWINP